MSLVRQYGHILINLTKIISIEQSGKILKLTLPVSNYFDGNFLNFYDSQIYKISNASEKDAFEEMINIQNTLNEYYKNKK